MWGRYVGGEAKGASDDKGCEQAVAVDVMDDSVLDLHIVHQCPWSIPCKQHAIAYKQR